MERRGFLKALGGLFGGAVAVPFIPVRDLLADEPPKIVIAQPQDVPVEGVDPYTWKVRQYFAKHYPKLGVEGQVGFDIKRAQFQVFHGNRWLGMTDPAA